MDGCWDDNVWPKYNDWVYNTINQKLKNTPKPNNVLLKYYAGSINNKGYLAGRKGDVVEQKKCYYKSLEIQKKIGDEKGVAVSLNNIGFIYYKQGDILNGLDYFIQSLKIREKIGDKEGVAQGLNNIGDIYYTQGDVEKALDYHQKSLEIWKEIKDKRGEATSLNNIGTIYSDQLTELLNAKADSLDILKKRELALQYYNRSLMIRESIEDKRGIAVSLINIGAVYEGMSTISSLNKALVNYQSSLLINEEIGNKYGVSQSLDRISRVMILQGKINLARDYATRALKIAQEIGYPKNIYNSAKKMSEIAKMEAEKSTSISNKAKLWREAYEMHELFVQMKDSINNEKTEKAAIRTQAKYEYEKKKAINDANYEKKIAIKKKENEKQKILIITSIVVLLLVLLLLFSVFSRLKITKKQKIEIKYAHDKLEEKNHEITESITYAERIQRAILPPEKELLDSLKDCFVFYRPKDIVAGDFYWLQRIGDTVLYATADCTGHGVPGAMVSVVCYNALNRAVREYNLLDPGLILDKTTEIVIETFERSGEDKYIRDGMDIALCALNIKTRKLQFAGANNPLYLVRGEELQEVKGDKQPPIGSYAKRTPFTNHLVEIKKGDVIYTFSDGYADQFGGPKGKKFMYKQFKELLLSINKEPMSKQHQVVESKFDEWKGELFQIDDVCVIGVRI
ncbi:MAG: tetratricopeptide repeat protein [Vicingus serpentipes]|nr:tetratricopeptide repeat protein [Vicingus serpentipes]